MRARAGARFYFMYYVRLMRDFSVHGIVCCGGRVYEVSFEECLWFLRGIEERVALLHLQSNI